MICNGPIVGVRFLVCSAALTVRKSAAHPSTATMVKEALKALDSRKGVSSQAMQNYIKQKYPSVDVVRLKHLVRTVLKKGIESGALVRPANSHVSTGATGKFRVTVRTGEVRGSWWSWTGASGFVFQLAPKVKEPKSKSENADPNVQKEAKENVAKKPPKAGLLMREKPPGCEQALSIGCVTGAEKKEAAKEGGKPQEVRTLWTNVLLLWIKLETVLWGGLVLKLSSTATHVFQDLKPPKKPKKDQAGTSKVAPAKKMAENGNDKDTLASAKTTKEPKAGKATRHKMAEKGSDAPAAKTTRKGGKKAAAWIQNFIFILICLWINGLFLSAFVF